MNVTINIMPKTGVLDPQGATIADTLRRLGFDGVGDVRQGKTVVLDIDASSEEDAKAKAQEMCKKLLVNDVVEEGQIFVAA